MRRFCNEVSVSEMEASRTRVGLRRTQVALCCETRKANPNTSARTVVTRVRRCRVFPECHSLRPVKRSMQSTIPRIAPRVCDCHMKNIEAKMRGQEAAARRREGLSIIIHAAMKMMKKRYVAKKLGFPIDPLRR